MIERAAAGSSASTPRSARDSVSNGFFFAAMMPLKFGKRASGRASVIEITVGSSAETRATPPSIARTPAIAPSEISTELREVACGTSSSSATMAGSTPPVPSVDWFPAITRSNPVRRSAAASTSAVSPRSAPSRASSTTCTAADAPIARPLRTVACADSGAIDSTTTSVPSCASAYDSATSSDRSPISSRTVSLAARSASPVSRFSLRSP